jgi:hypothetical protein
MVGGTGKLGAALARRWAKAGLPVTIGSRRESRARETAEALSAALGCAIGSGSNPEAATTSDIVVVTVPYAAQAETLRGIAEAASGKIVIDTTVPLEPPKIMRVHLPPEGSAALRARAMLGARVRLVTAFHNVAAHKLATDAALDCDVLVFGDERAAREEVVRLARLAGLRGIHGGPLVNAVAAEALTSVLIFINRTYSVDGAGLRITGALAEPKGD